MAKPIQEGREDPRRTTAPRVAEQRANRAIRIEAVADPTVAPAGRRNRTRGEVPGLELSEPRATAGARGGAEARRLGAEAEVGARRIRGRPVDLLGLASAFVGHTLNWSPTA